MIADFSHFNSIKVRLEQNQERESYAKVAHFNSIKVRLELLWYRKHQDIPKISIP